MPCAFCFLVDFWFHFIISLSSFPHKVSTLLQGKRHPQREGYGGKVEDLSPPFGDTRGKTPDHNPISVVQEFPVQHCLSLSLSRFFTGSVQGVKIIGAIRKKKTKK